MTPSKTEKFSRQVKFDATPTFSSERGLRLGRVTVSGAKNFSGDIFIEKHQGKHADGDWGYRGKSGSTFSPMIASTTELNLFRVIVIKMFWVNALEAGSGVDEYFVFPDIKRMAKNKSDETAGVHVQASYHPLAAAMDFFNSIVTRTVTLLKNPMRKSFLVMSMIN